jgi:pepF/M3 family oligoendopeptidase
MTTAAPTLPRWDMTVVHSGLDSPAFERDLAETLQAMDVTVALFDRLGIDKRDPAPLDEATLAAFEEAAGALNALIERARTLYAYVYSFVSTDSRDNLAQARFSAFRQEAVKLTLLGTRFTAWVGGLDVEALITRSELAREHAFMLRRARQRAAHLMAPAEEALAAELDVTGGSAWARLHSNLSSQLTVAVEIGGERRELAMSEVRNLAFEPDRALRRRAYEAELAAWEKNALPLASALNSIKGQVNALSRRRGWESPLEAALFDNNIDRQTLDAMLGAAREFFPDFRRYLRAKARLLGLERLAWYDMFAPVGGGGRSWAYDDAAEFIVAQFGRYSQRLSDFAARAFRESWIDAEPRAGKVGGAFCMALRGDESRILSNYKPTIESVLTMAHELGHGYHNLNLARQTMLNKDTPMTLAETASIFCETIIRHAAMEGAGRDEQLEILEAAVQGACQVVVDITSRFLFESAVFDGRQKRELSVDELNALMLDAQRQTYGDGLDQEVLHPTMWAVKGHYYSSGRSFYNFPYMFGLLFGLGLYAIYTRDPEPFKQGYDDLLASTGLADAAELAGRMGIDIRSIDFWRASLSIIRADIDRFEALVP